MTLSQTAWAAAVSWDAGGDGVNWSSANNWSGNALPTSADDVTIGGTYSTTVDASFANIIKSLTIDNGGSVTLSRNLTVDGADVTINGTLTLGSNTLSVYTGNIVVNATTGVLSGATGKVYMESGIDRSFNIGSGVTLGTLEVSGTGSSDRTFTISASSSSTLTIDNELILTGRGALSLSSTTLTYSTAKLTYNRNDYTVGDEWSSNPDNIEIKANTVTLNSDKSSYSGSVKLNGGSLSIGASGNLAIGGTLEIVSGTVTNSGTLSYGASSLLKYNTGANYSIGGEWTGSVVPKSVEITIGGGNTLSLVTPASRTMNKNLALTSGILDLGAKSITVLGDIAGDLSGSGAIGNNTTLNIGNGGSSLYAQAVTGAVTLNKLVVNKSGAGGGAEAADNTVSVNGTFIFTPSGSLTVTAGTLNFTTDSRISNAQSGISSLVVTVSSGGVLKTGGTDLTGVSSIDAQNGKIAFTGSGGENLPAASKFAGSSINTLEVNNSSTGLTVGSGTVTISASLVLTNGVITTTTSNILLLASGATISGTPSSSKMISGPLQKAFTATGSFVYPIGLSGNGYKPLTFNYTAGSFGGTSVIEVAFSSSGVTAGTLPSGIAGIQTPEHYTIVEKGTAPTGLVYSITATYEDANFSPETRNRVLIGATGAWTVGTTAVPGDINTTDNTVLGSGFNVVLTTQRNIVFGSGGTINYWTNTGGDDLWFTSTNWSAGVPTSTDDVVIDDLHGDATPNVSISLVTNDATALTLTIKNNCQVTAGGGTTKQLKISGTGLALTVESGGTMVVTRSGNVIFFDDAGDYNENYTDFQSGSTYRRTAGSVKNDDYANLDLAGATSVGTSVAVSEALDVSTANVTSGTIVLTGSSVQTISASSASLYNLEINNATGATLGSAVTLTGTLTLTSGIINTTGTNLLTVAATSGGSTTSYVNGPLAITGNGAKTFPIGKGSIFRPVYVTGTTSTATTFELFNTKPNGSTVAPFRISLNRYWRGTGGIQTSTQVQLTFVFGVVDGVDTRSTITVASANAVNGAYSDRLGTAGSATLLGLQATNLSSAALLGANPEYFTLGTSSTTDNPLPVELMSFEGLSTENGINLTWKTGSEKDSRGFILSRRVKGTESWSALASHATNSALKATNSLSGASYSFSDRFEMMPGDKFEYKLEEEDLTGNRVVLQILTVESRYNTTIQSFALGQNYPNPFNPTTTIMYNVKQSAKVTIDLFNLLGQKVKTLVSKDLERGSYQVQLNANELTSGVYFYRMAAASASGNFVESKKMVLLK
ncbi:MAG: T9SS type A sorting domain-containing protein [Desulfobulbaceae bacterium]|nr:T9SS type A sorting domain-containing protein [Desulfobulbaceae bacterium]